MNIEHYLEFLDYGDGHLEKNNNKMKPNHPDYVGYIKGYEHLYRICGWINDDNGKKKLFLRLYEANFDGTLKGEGW
jgi:hypothetical protein